MDEDEDVTTFVYPQDGQRTSNLLIAMASPLSVPSAERNIFMQRLAEARTYCWQVVVSRRFIFRSVQLQESPTQPPRIRAFRWRTSIYWICSVSVQPQNRNVAEDTDTRNQAFSFWSHEQGVFGFAPPPKEAGAEPWSERISNSALPFVPRKLPVVLPQGTGSTARRKPKASRGWGPDDSCPPTPIRIEHRSTDGW